MVQNNMFTSKKNFQQNESWNNRKIILKPKRYTFRQVFPNSKKKKPKLFTAHNIEDKSISFFFLDCFCLARFRHLISNKVELFVKSSVQSGFNLRRLSSKKKIEPQRKSGKESYRFRFFIFDSIYSFLLLCQYSVCSGCEA